jgi:hypothetical protein
MNTENETVYLTYNQAHDLVKRIADRATNFNHEMSGPEKEAMSQLLSDVGVKVSDLIDVSSLADNYAINAEIVTPSDVDNYDRSSLRDALFTWKEDGETFYCLSW